MSDQPYRLDSVRTFRIKFLGVIVRAVLWVVWLLVFFWFAIWFVPPYERTFRDFGMRLPWATEMVLTLGRGVIPYGVLLVLAFITADGIGSFLLHQSAPRRVVRVLWSGLMIAVPVFAIIVTAVAVWLPSTKFQEMLSR
jgi:type II secretory pathway component PulF